MAVKITEQMVVNYVPSADKTVEVLLRSFGEQLPYLLLSGGRRRVKLLSPHHRFVIVLHSPTGFVQTGLRGFPPEKMAAKPGQGGRRDILSGPV